MHKNNESDELIAIFKKINKRRITLLRLVWILYQAEQQRFTFARLVVITSVLSNENSYYIYVYNVKSPNIAAIKRNKQILCNVLIALS